MKAALLGLIVFLTAFAAHAQDADSTDRWKATFGDAAVSYFRAPVKSVAVAVGGEASADGKAAAKALESAFRSGGVGLVMDTGQVGDLPGDTDADIVNTVSHLPVDAVAIVRIFGDSPPTAVVTLYSRTTGESVGGFSATRGEALAKRTATPAPIDEAPPQSANAGVSTAASEAVARVGKKNRRREQLDDDEDPVADRRPAPRTSRGSGRYRLVTRDWDGRDFFLVEDGVKLTGAEVYKAIGRDDLAQRYRSRQVKFWGLTVGGTAVAGIGLAVALSAIDTCIEELDGPCPDNTGRQVLGWSLMGAGSAGLLAALLFRGHPVTTGEFAQLADEDLAFDGPGDSSVTITAAPTRGGGFVGLVGTF